MKRLLAAWLPSLWDVRLGIAALLVFVVATARILGLDAQVGFLAGMPSSMAPGMLPLAGLYVICWMLCVCLIPPLLLSWGLEQIWLQHKQLSPGASASKK